LLIYYTSVLAGTEARI